MKFFKKYWYLIVITVLTIGLGVVTFLTTQKLQQAQPVAPSVPQEQPQAAEAACTIRFSLTTTNTPTQTPTGTQTPTQTPTATPTGVTYTPSCTGISLNPSSGNGPQDVTVICSGTVTGGDITAAEFTFGDGSATQLVEKNVGSPGSETVKHTFPNGNYSVSCRVRDNNFHFSDTPDACKAGLNLGPTVTPGGPTNTPGPTSTPGPGPTPIIPVSGSGPSVLGASAISLGAILLLLGLAF